jgi:hypothetical protein
MITELEIDWQKVKKVATRSPLYEFYARKKAEEIKQVAIAVYLGQQRADNEARTSETSPPKYLLSWEIKQDGSDFFLINTDPGAMWVEFGARAGGKTRVLRYKPLTRALDIVGVRETYQ